MAGKSVFEAIWIAIKSYCIQRRLGVFIRKRCLFIFGLFPEKFRVLSFPDFGQFVYFRTFPGKIQSFAVSANLFIFGLFPEKIQSFHFSFSIAYEVVKNPLRKSKCKKPLLFLKGFSELCRLFSACRFLFIGVIIVFQAFLCW